MRARLPRLFVVLVVMVVAGVQMLPSRALGTVVLTGEVRAVCSEWDPACEFPNQYLSRIVYDAQIASANTVTFEYVPGVNDFECIPGEVGPGSCGSIGTGHDRFVFTEVFADITATGLCKTASTRVGICANTHTDFYGGWPIDAVPTLPVIIRTRSLNDQITAVIPPLGQRFAFTINTGEGNDVVTLVDASSQLDGGVDSISCGGGMDRVSTTLDVLVANDCETVERL
jgi:hypothetical protein